MEKLLQNRRAFLRVAAATAAGGACVSFAATAHAVTPVTEGDYGAVLGQACGRSGEHAKLIAETAASLGRPQDDPLVQAVLKKATCPVCGCSLMPAPVDGARLSF